MFDTESYLDEVFAACVRGEGDLFEDQLDAIDWAWKRPKSALFLDVGKGKTVISGTIIDRLITRGYAAKILIIAPIRVANRVWMKEFKFWHHLAYLNPAILRIDDDDPRVVEWGDHVFTAAVAQGMSRSEARKDEKKARTNKKQELLRKTLDDPSQIHVINQEAFSWLVDAWFERERWPYQVVIFDEASRARDHNSEIVKAFRRVLSKIKRLHLLTASPASQTYMHLFAQMYLLDEGVRLGTHITPFRKRYFDHNLYNHTYALRPGAAEEIEEKIADICLVQRRDRNFIVRPRYVDLPAEAMKQYRDFEKNLVLELPDDVIIDAVNGGVLSNKLLQFASGAVYDDIKRYHVLHDEKIDELKALEEETLDNPVMVAYWYKSSLARLKKVFPKAGVMDREGKLEEPWNKRKFKMMFVHPRGAAHGLNLQFGGHHIALFDIFWPLELFTQLIGRLDRQGQTDTVMVHLLAARGTMDETVAANLQLLQDAEDAMFRRLQALRRKLRNVREPD